MIHLYFESHENYSTVDVKLRTLCWRFCFRFKLSLKPLTIIGRVALVQSFRMPFIVKVFVLDLRKHRQFLFGVPENYYI